MTDTTNLPTSQINLSEQQSEQPSETTQPRLELIDLINCRLCLQLMTRRGAVLASEMEGFGKVYNNINTFLKQMAPGSISLEDPSTIPSENGTNNGLGTSNTVSSENVSTNSEISDTSKNTTISL
tara:strand:- start:18 stop:392 length:375 start_codon:yes stop_codon:yes gene_type:complete